MSREWRETTLGEVVNFRRGHDLPKTKMEEGTIPVVGSNGIIGYHNEYTTDVPCVSIGRSGNVGNPHIVMEKCWAHNTTLYIDDFLGNDEVFIYYFLQTLNLENFRGGSAVPTLNRNHIHPLEVRIPPLTEQKAIAHILGSLDDKIELNRKMNETLEAMAQALFKSWFVDFDPVIDNALAVGNEIPDELTERAEQRKALGDKRKHLPEEIRQLFPSEFEFTDELGYIPKGWEVLSLIDLIDLIGGGTPKTSIPEYWDGDIPWFSVVDAPDSSDVFVVDTEKHITEFGLNNSSTKILPFGTIIISARGTVGKCAIVGKNMAMNQSCYGIHGKSGISNYYIYYVIRDSIGDLQKSGHGSVFNTITRDTFKIVKVPYGNKTLTRIFEEKIKPNFDKILANINQIRELAKLRDTLLPKLLSGEIRSKNAEELINNVR